MKNNKLISKFKHLILLLTAITLSSPTYASGLIAAYAFDEGTGATSADLTGLGHTPTMANVSWSSSGIHGGAIALNGENSLITIANSLDLQLTTAMTLEAWIKPTDLTTSATVIAKDGANAYDFALFSADRNAPPKFSVNNSTGTNAVYATELLAVNSWTHLAGTFDGQTVKLYINGSLIHTEQTPGQLTNNALPLYIGGVQDSPNLFSGLIDDVRIYNRALSASEINFDMKTPVGQSGKDTSPPTVITKYPESSANTVPTNSQIEITFSEPIDPATINNSTLLLIDSNSAPISVVINYNKATNKATIKPTNALLANSQFTISLLGGSTSQAIKDISGNALLSTLTWSFSTNTDVATFGQWGQKINFTTVPVAAAILPNGKLLIWSSWDRYDFRSGVGARDKTYTNLYDPVNGKVSEYLITNTNHDMFCPGTAMLENGHIHVSGGGPEVTSTSLYDYTRNQWQSDSNMSRPRWYNASTLLPSGQVFTLGGIPADGIGELWTEGAGWKVMNGLPVTPMINDNGSILPLAEEHPKLFVAPNGKLFAVGPSPNMNWYDTAANNGNGKVTFAGRRSDDIYAQNNVAVMYNIGKLLAAGGNPNYDLIDAGITPSSKNAYLVDINNQVSVKKTQAMHYPRAYANGVVLPNGKIFVVGGLDNGKNFTDVGAIMVPEMFDPLTETWTEMAKQPTPRTYHSVALLLPDASVFVGGGGLGGGCNCNHPDGEIYKPPYFFNGIRPQITTSPPASISYNTAFTVKTSSDVTQFNLIRLSSVTHTVNTDQRFLNLQSTGDGNGNFSIISPANANLAPPGFYMLFALNASGVPSVAKIIQLTGKIAPVIKSITTQTNPVSAIINFPIVATSSLNESLSFSATGLPSGLAINPSTGLISGTLTLAGSSNVTVIASGQRGGSSSTTFTWVVTELGAPVNVAKIGIATQSSTNSTFGAKLAIDGNTNGSLSGGSVSITNPANNAWWELDLGKIQNITTVNIWNRTDCCANQLSNFYVLVSDVPFSSKTLALTLSQPGVSNSLINSPAGSPTTIQTNRTGRYIRIQLAGTNNLNLAEVEVMARQNRVPSVTNPGNKTIAVGSTVSFAVPASDPDGDLLNFSASGLPNGLSIDSVSGLITGTPTVAGTHQAIVTVTDGKGGISPVNFSITVNMPMTLAPLQSPPQSSGIALSLSASVVGGINPKYSWQFGDGTAASPASTSPAVSHIYAKPGRYVVNVTVTDDLGTTLIGQLVQAIHSPTTANRPHTSSAIIYEQQATIQSSRVWTVNPDNNSVTVFDGNLTKLAEIPVGKSPQTVAIASDGQIWVVNQISDSISIINPITFQVSKTLPLPVASQPYGIVFDPAGLHAYVTLEAIGAVWQLETAFGRRTSSVSINRNIRHLSVTSDGSALIVSRFITPKLPGEHTNKVKTTDALGKKLGGQIVILSTSPQLNLVKTVVLQHSEASDSSSSARGLPNYLSTPVISPDGLSAWIPSKQDNIKRGMYRDQLQLTFESTVRAISSRIDLNTLAEDYSYRIDHDNSSVGSAATFDNSGSYLFVALETSREVAVIDPYIHKELMRINVGRAPQGLSFASDANQDRLYVHNFMDRTVSAFDLTQLIRTGTTQISAIATKPSVASEELNTQVLFGKKLFYDALDSRLARDHYLSCASCHNNGGNDGRVWDLTGFGEGLRNTIDLRGHAGMSQGKLHWTGNFDEVQDFEGQIRTLSGGKGLMNDIDFNAGTRSQALGDTKLGISPSLDALAAYVTSLNTLPRSPYRIPDAIASLSSEGLAGQALFTSKNCNNCHSSSIFTDSPQSLLHDIGTLKPGVGSRLGIPIISLPTPGLDTPTLRGIWATAPYLHDGSATTIELAIQAHTSIPPLTATELSQLGSYLRQLDNNP